MKTRVISALCALLIILPVIYIGGTIFNIAAYILSIIALHEMLKAKTIKKDLPIFIKFISLVSLSIIMFNNTLNVSMDFNIDIRVLIGIFMVFLLPVILYHDRKIYSVNDAFYLIGTLFFLGISFSTIILIRELDIKWLFYIISITISTDTYAYTIGSLIGKNKLLKDISPNKTCEGMIAGTLLGSFIGTCFAYYVINPSSPIYIIILLSVFLSIIAQMGDLVFSAIKRYFNVKDFSNIMPGHGGILDRLDSLIFASLAFMFFYQLF